MDDNIVTSIDLEYHNNDDDYTLSSHTESNRSVVITSNPKQTAAIDSKEISLLKNLNQ